MNKKEISCVLNSGLIQILKNKNHEFVIALEHPEAFNEEGLFELRDLVIRAVNDHSSSLLNLNSLRISGNYLITHNLNVALLSCAIGSKMGVVGTELSNLVLGALVHDCGKSKIPNKLLLKSGSLTSKEIQLIKLHVPLGYKMLKQDLKLDPIIARIALEHHEHFDGSGYPRGLSYQDLHFNSLVISVVNAFEQLLVAKKTSQSMSHRSAVKMLLSQSKYYNPQILYTMVHMIKFH